MKRMYPVCIIAEPGVLVRYKLGIGIEDKLQADILKQIIAYGR